MREPSFAFCLPSSLALLFPSFSPPQFSSPWSCLEKVPARQILAKGHPSKEQSPREMPPTSQALSLLSTLMLIPGPLKEIAVLTAITKSKAQPVGVGAAQTMKKIPAFENFCGVRREVEPRGAKVTCPRLPSPSSSLIGFVL